MTKWVFKLFDSYFQKKFRLIGQQIDNLLSILEKLFKYVIPVCFKPESKLCLFQAVS